MESDETHIDVISINVSITALIRDVKILWSL
jgi:hypothetical protein